MSLLVRNKTALRASAAAASLPPVRALRLTLSTGGEADVRLTIPPQHREGDLVSYTLLVRLAFDPGEPPGADGVAWKVDWPAYLASHQNTVVADVTLPGRPPSPWSSSTAVINLQEVIRTLVSRYEFLEAQRVVVVGRGLGGQLGLRLLAQPEPVITCAVAIAPVTTWRSYGELVVMRALVPTVCRFHDNIRFKISN